jgi:hypothetical protein
LTHLFELGREKRAANTSMKSALLTLPSSTLTAFRTASLKVQPLMDIGAIGRKIPVRVYRNSAEREFVVIPSELRAG